MKEREGQDQNELTRQADSSNLETGDIFMPDQGEEQGQTRPQSGENLTPDQRRQLEGVFNAPGTSVDAKRVISSMLWGRDYDPEDADKSSRGEPFVGKDVPPPERQDKDFVPKHEPSDGKTQENPIQKALDELSPTERQFADQFIQDLSPELLRGGLTANDIAQQAFVIAKNPEAANAYMLNRRMRQNKKEKNKEAIIERTQEEIRAEVNLIRESESLEPKKVKDALDTLIERAKDASDLAKKKYDEAKYKEYSDRIAKLEALSKSGDIKGVKDALSDDFVKDVKSHYERIEEGEVPDVPESLEDLAALIMKRESEEWKIGGSKELLDSEGKVIKENFMAWVRTRMIAIHDFNPSSTADFFSGITVKGRWSQISLYDMVLTGSTFLEKKKEQIVVGKNEDGTIKYENQTTYAKNEDYEKLRHQLLMEAFLFQTSRNAHVEYVAVQADDVELPKLLSRLYATNVFTRGDNLEFILSMPSMDKDKATEDEKQNRKQGREIEAKLDHNFEIGQAARKLLMAYYYIYDYDTLQNILGEDSTLFKETYRDIDSATGKDAIDGNGQKKEAKKSEGHKSGSEPYNTQRWYENGKLKFKNIKDKAEFMEYINVFTGPGPTKDAKIIDEVRERMVQSIMEKMGLDYTEAKYAEAWAFSMTRWTGMAAKNDTAAVGHDAWAKVQNTQEYRFRQMADKRNALFGNIFNVLGIKRLGTNWFEGIRDTEGRTIIEAIQGGEGAKMDLDTAIRARGKKNKGKPISFNDDSMRLFSANHINNSFFLQEFLIDHNGFNFQDFLTIDSNGRPVIDYEKANKMIGGVSKAIRYAYSTWPGLDYSKTVRTWEMVEDEYTDEYGVNSTVTHARAKDLPILAQFFGPEILAMLKEEARRQGINRDKKQIAYLAKMTPEQRRKYEADQKKKGVKKDKVWDMGGEVGELNVTEIQEHAVRDVLWKSAMKYLVQAEIESHRNIFSDQERFNMLKIEQIYSFLETKHFFTAEEIKEMRKETHTGILGMMLLESGGSWWVGLKEAMKVIRANSVTLVSN